MVRRASALVTWVLVIVVFGLVSGAATAPAMAANALWPPNKAPEPATGMVDYVPSAMASAGHSVMRLMSTGAGMAMGLGVVTLVTSGEYLLPLAAAMQSGFTWNILGLGGLPTVYSVAGAGFVNAMAVSWGGFLGYHLYGDLEPTIE